MEGQAKGKHIVLPLDRPQYVSLPEALSSALAWSRYRTQLIETDEVGAARTVALMFHAGSNANKTLKTLRYQETCPDNDASRLAKFGIALNDAGLKCRAPDDIFARAASASVRGLKSNKSANQPAAPISEALALLQNNQGFLGAAKPPRMDRILESLFDLGAPVTSADLSVAGRWRGAVNHRLEIDRIVRSLDSAARASLISFDLVKSDDLSTTAPSSWAGLLDGTPFSWFRRTWLRLTSDEWVEALPARVWVDWASTVLRMAIGTGFLWEALWYETVARAVLSEQPTDWRSLRREVVEVMPWKSSANDVGVRDVSSILLWRVRRSNQIKLELQQWIDKSSAGEEEITRVLREMSMDNSLVKSLELAMVSQSRGSKNLWESIKYSLLAREEAGEFADNYGLLRARSNRFLTPTPGTEWMAVMSSLCVEHPGRQVHLRDVMESLAECGLRPELSEITALLERAGLARGSADADEGVVVQSAF